MNRQFRLIHVAAAVSVLLYGSASYAQEAEQPGGTNPSAAPATPPPAEPAPAAAQPVAPAPGYYSPPAYAYPPPAAYAPPPGYYYPPQQPGYYPPPAPAYYPPQPIGPPPGYHTHDGFFLRLNSGIGIMHAKYSYAGYDTTISGGGMALSFAMGGAITPNLVIYGEFMATGAFDPTIKTGSSSSGMSGDVTLTGFGPGVAYYLEPANLYFSGTMAFSQVTVNYDDGTSDSNSRDLTDRGFGMAVTVGKEWWVSQNWGLGVAALLHVASMKVKSVDTRMTAEGISILFSATYN